MTLAFRPLTRRRTSCGLRIRVLFLGLLLLASCDERAKKKGEPGKAEKRPVWAVSPTGTDELLLSLAFFDEKHGIAVGGNRELGPSVVLASADGGLRWSAGTAEAQGRLYDVDVLDGRSAIAVGCRGVILRTEDRGKTWQALESLAPQWLAGVDFVSASTGYVVGGQAEGALLWKTTDAGAHWVSFRKTLPEQARGFSLRDVKFLSEKRGFLVGEGGLILETTDGGASWVVRKADSDAWLRSISVLGKTLFIAGKGVLLRSVDDGQTWGRLPIPPQRKLNDVAFVSEQVGWITGFGGEILETRDGGQHWLEVYRQKSVTVAIHVAAERILVSGGGGLIVSRRR